MNMQIKQAGFTLVEAIVVMVITGIIASMVGVFISKPIQGYFASSRRAEMTDTAVTSIKRISRDLQAALPNSIRMPLNASSALCMEFIPTYAGGRYRAVGTDALDIGSSDSSFDVLGGINPVPVTGDHVVVSNLGIPGFADAYEGSNRAKVTGGSAANLTIAATTFPAPSPGNNFQVIPGSEQAVFYSCDNIGTDAAGNGTGVLYRFSGYGFNAPFPGACPTATATTPILATNLSSCEFHYAPVMERNALVWMNLSIRKENETVSLHHEVHVNNTP